MRWACSGTSGVGVEVVGAKFIRGGQDLLPVCLVMEVADMVLQCSVRVKLALYEG